MRKLIGSLFSAKSSAADSTVDDSQNGLKAAFQQSREMGNIDLVWPVLKAATLYVVVAATDQGEHWFLTRSPTPERFCVTAAERPEFLSTVPWPKKKILGLDLVQALGPAHEIVVVYPDGGDYVTSEQLAWYRQLG